ncbi:MAG: nicotinate (nicotinamide) nucleotide adenylyltransferase [Chlorobiaceae bacterium]
MHLAVFGGTFDPPHNGHLALCLLARELLDIDRLIISVSNNPFKKNSEAGDAHRMHMAELISSEINRTGFCCEVSRWELDKQQPSYTVDLLRYLHARYPNERLSLLVGEDSFRDFSSWKECEKLFLLCDVVVFRRSSTMVTGLPVTPNVQHWKEAIRFIDFAYPVSSTEVRVVAGAGNSLSRLVPASLHCYITEHAIYRRCHSSTSTQGQKLQES